MMILLWDLAFVTPHFLCKNFLIYALQHPHFQIHHFVSLPLHNFTSLQVPQTRTLQQHSHSLSSKILIDISSLVKYFQIFGIVFSNYSISSPHILHCVLQAKFWSLFRLYQYYTSCFIPYNWRNLCHMIYPFKICLSLF